MLSGVESVVHLAAIITISPATAERAWDVNVRGAESTARAALDAGVSRFVHCSSIHAFDCTDGTGPLDATSPRSADGHLPPYDRSKAAGEARVRAVHAEGLNIVVVHPGGVTGPGDHTPSLMGQIFRKILEGTMPGAMGRSKHPTGTRPISTRLGSP